MGYEYKVTLPDGEVVELRFKDFGEIPGRVSLDNQGNSEAQLWLSLEWGLEEPKNFPADSELPGIRVFADLPMKTILKIHNAWQAYVGVTQGESSASKTSSESTATS